MRYISQAHREVSIIRNHQYYKKRIMQTINYEQFVYKVWKLLMLTTSTIFVCLMKSGGNQFGEGRHASAL